MLALIVLVGFFMTGLIGCILPVVPGPAIVWIGMVIHKIWVPEASAHWMLILIAGVFVGITFLMDYVLTILGAKKFGASRKGAVGALVGGFVGFIIPPFLIWLIIGPFVGALIGELLDGQNLQQASRVGWGSFLGTIAAYVSKLTICFLIIAAFMVNTVF
ncbi:MAG: DUF456 family protein [Verrucomicrobia bacterium]|nr:DUF456 family protein [Verrucomicrobiota bacterium]MDA1066735.1 DUF456 family protein [Verrucomicrobiota bacterium]